jgi:putative endonuclease
MYTVYVLESTDGRRYTGHTNDLERRLLEHNTGVCRTTSRSTGWHVVHAEDYRTRADAIRRERWLKTGTGRDYLKRKIGKQE